MTFELWYKVFKKNRLAIFGAFVVIVFFIIVIFGHWIAPYNPTEQSYTDLLRAPSPAHLFGTDHLGRDIFSRVIVGARYSFLIGFGVVFVEGVIGVLLGVIAGFFGGYVDNIIMRLVDTMLSIPPMVLALVIAGTFGGGLVPVILAMVVISWGHFTRLVRGEALAVRENLYIDAARALGCSDTTIITRHLLPNTVSTAIVFSTLEIPWAILFSAALSFLGVGVQPPTPEWGNIIAEGRNYLTTQWWIATFPGLVLMVIVLSFNFVGDGLRDALDPKLSREH